MAETVKPLVKPLFEPAPTDQMPAAAEATAITKARGEFVGIVERLASNPNVDLAKLEKIIELQERILRRDAEAEFNASFAEMQPEIPVVPERGRTDTGTYAELEDIVERIRPVLGKYGFALSHQTEWPGDGWIKIVGILTHRSGHQRRSEFLSKADPSGSKNAIQGLGSTVSYGRRYTTKDLLCIVTRREDDDGKASNGNGGIAPEGFENWSLDMEACADEGVAKLHKAWNDAKPEFRRYAFAARRRWWETVKKKAEKVKP